MNWKKTVLLSIIILAAGVLLTALIFNTEPTAQKSGATKQTAMLVDVQQVEKGTYRPTFKAVGNVRPSQHIMLRPRVEGQIISISPGFTPGGFVQKGDTLLQIDPADYRLTLEQRRSELNQAVADLNIEMGLQDVSKKEYQLYDTTKAKMDPLTPEQKRLFLREPQLQSARSAVKLAQAAVNMAELQLRRTTITAPFDAHILSRNVNTGSQVTPGDNLARLVGDETYWAEISISLSHLKWLNTGENSSGNGEEVIIRNRTAWMPHQYRTGYLYKVIGSLENQTRMARVLVEVADPLARQTDKDKHPPLMVGAFVEVDVPGKPLKNTIRLQREYVRNNQTVWIMKDRKLEILPVNVVLKDQKYAYINEGLKHGAKVVTTDLSTVSDGAPLRLNNQTADTTQNALTEVKK